MDQQKIVVVLLLITIILSVVTVIITLGVNAPDLGGSKSVKIANPQDLYSVEAGNVALTVEAPNTSGG